MSNKKNKQSTPMTVGPKGELSWTVKIELKKFTHSERLSEETNCFSADVYINGEKAASAHNRGHGGPTDYHPYKGKEELVKAAEQYFASLPPQTHKSGDYEFSLQPSLEGAIDDEVTRILVERDLARSRMVYLKKLAKDCIYGICFGTDDKYWMQKFNYPIATILAAGPRGREAIIKALTVVKEKHLKEGPRILNGNIPDEILHQVFPPQPPANEY